MTIFALPILKLHRNLLWVLLFLTMVYFIWVPAGIICHVPPISLNDYEPSPIVYWNPINFLPYVLIASLTGYYYSLQERFDISSKKYVRMILCLLFLFLLSSCCEWKWISHASHQVHGGYIPSYMRLSVVIGACLLFLLSLSIKRRPGKIISFFSKHSLGIYCLHPFVIGFLEGYVGRPKGDFIYFLGVISLTAIVSFFTKRAFEQRLI